MTHRLLDLAWENYRIKHLGEPKRGSTGRESAQPTAMKLDNGKFIIQFSKKTEKNFRKRLVKKLKELKIQSNMFVKQTNLIGTISLKY